MMSALRFLRDTRGSMSASIIVPLPFVFSLSLGAFEVVKERLAAEVKVIETSLDAFTQGGAVLK